MYGLYQIMYFTLIDILNTMLSPFFIVLFLFIYYQYYKLEEEGIDPSPSLFRPFLKAINSSFIGFLGGFLATIIFTYLGIQIVPLDFIYIIGLSLILSTISTRFVCISYSGSILALSSILLNFPFRITDDIMLIVASLHIVESILIAINGHRGVIPIYLERGSDLIGGFSMNRFWPIPFVIFIGDGLIRPITLMTILAYGDFTTSYVREKTFFSSIILFAYSIILIALIKLQSNTLIPPVFALLGHEFIIHINIFLEKKRMPIFSSIESGVRVLEVSKNGIGKKLGISPGDIILSINDYSINSLRDISEIQSLEMNALRVKFISRKKGFITKTYKGDKKTLGISIVPRAIY